MKTFKTVMVAVAFLSDAACAADLRIDVPTGDPDRLLAPGDLAGLGAADSLVKTGGGRLVVRLDLGSAKPGWIGAVCVQEGTLRVAHAGALGASGAAGAVVSSGATVEFDGSFLGSSSLDCPKLAVSGSGVGGNGAICLVGGNWSHKTMRWTLTGATTWSSPEGFAETFNYGPSGSIDMGGHTLTVRGNGSGGTLALASTETGFFVNPGHVVVHDRANLKTEQTGFEGTDANTLTFASSSTWTIANLPRDRCRWKVIVRAGVTANLQAPIWASAWPAEGSGWSGPVEIATGGSLAWNAQFNADCQQSFVLSGPVTGEGKLACNYGVLKVANAANAVAEIQNYNGRLVATSLEAVMPSFANGRFYTNYGAATSVVQLVASDMTAANDAAVLNYMNSYPDGFRGKGNQGCVFLLPMSGWSFSSEFTDAFTDEKALLGNGGVADLPEPAGFRVTGPVTGGRPVAVTKAETALRFAGTGTHALGQLRLSGGETSFSDAGFYDLGTGRHFIGAEHPGVARLTVAAGAVLGNRDATGVGTAIVVGRSPLDAARTARGVLTLDGGTLTNCVSMGDGTNTSALRSQGSFVLKDGAYVCCDTSGGTVVCVGNRIGGYLSQRGGALDFIQGWFTVGQGEDGFGVLEQLGGTYVHRVYGLGVGRGGGHGHAYFGGTGRAELVSLRLCHSLWSTSAGSANVRATFTVDGSARVRAPSLQVGASSDSVTILNLNGGVLEVPPTFAAITNSTQLHAGMSNFDFTNNVVCLNLDGGELRPDHGSSALFSGEDEGAHPFRVVVGTGGLRLNTCNAKGVTSVFTVSRALLPPRGKGIGSIPVPEAAPWEYTGAPYVEIEGDGWGASALAQFDSEAGVVTNVLVTSPGCDYTWARARFVKGGAAQDVETPLDGLLVESATDGGISVYGGGALSLSGRNGYHGATRIGQDTTVVFWTRECYPCDADGNPLSDLDNAGGTFRLGASNQTEIHFPSLLGFGRIEGGCGPERLEVTVRTALVVDANDLLAGRIAEVRGRLTLAGGARVRVLNGDALASSPPGTRLKVAMAARGAVADAPPVLEGLGEDWGVRLGAVGVRLVRKGAGLSVIVR